MVIGGLALMGLCIVLPIVACFCCGACCCGVAAAASQASTKYNVATTNVATKPATVQVQLVSTMVIVDAVLMCIASMLLFLSPVPCVNRAQHRS